MRMKLELMSGAQDGEIINVKRSSTIGREKSNEIAMQYDRYISRRHARLITGDDEVFLDDLGSTNGTFYAGERVVGRVELQNGDFFRVGRTWVLITW